MSFGLNEFISLLAQDEDFAIDERIYNYFSNTDIGRLKTWLNRLERVRNYQVKGRGVRASARRGKQAALVGKILEQAVRVLLDGCLSLEHGGNVRSTVSEIDFLISINPSSRALPLFRFADNTHAIGEAKCYSSSPKTEWVNELAGILKLHHSNLGILFLASPPRELKREIRMAVAMHSAGGAYIIPFGLTQFDRVLKGGNFLKVLSDQSVEARIHSTSLCI